jgi:hypothetical protein
MFSKFRRHLALVVVSAFVLACMASAAPAATVDLVGGGTITGNAGATQFTFNTARRTISCTGSALNATSQPPGRYLGVALPFTYANTQLSFSGCTLTGGIRAPVGCAGTIALWQGTRLTAGGVTPNQITNNSCAITLSGTCYGTIAGSVSGSYDNTANKLTVTSPGGQGLAFTKGALSTCTTLPNDPSITYAGVPGPDVVYAIAPVSTMTVT